MSDFADDTFIVICRDDTVDGVRGAYVLATRQVFRMRWLAEAYANGVAPGREPLVVAGRWHQLRLG